MQDNFDSDALKKVGHDLGKVVLFMFHLFEADPK